MATPTSRIASRKAVRVARQKTSLKYHAASNKALKARKACIAAAFAIACLDAIDDTEDPDVFVDRPIYIHQEGGDGVLMRGSTAQRILSAHLVFDTHFMNGTCNGQFKISPRVEE